MRIAKFTRVAALTAATVASLLALRVAVADPARNNLIDQKIRLAERLIEKVEPAKAQSIRDTLSQVRDAAGKGDFETAERLLGQAHSNAFSAYRSSRPDASQKREREAYERRRDEVETFRTAFRELIAGEPDSPAAQADLNEAESLIARAEEGAGNKNYKYATGLLMTAYDRLIFGFKRLKDNQTVEYRLEFASKEEEYDYEKRRYGTYELLLQRRLDGGEVRAGNLSRVQESRQSAKSYAQQADELAEQGKFADALQVREQATQSLIAALRQSGMMLP